MRHALLTMHNGRLSVESELSTSALLRGVSHFGEMVWPPSYEANMLSPILELVERSLRKVEDPSQSECKLKIDEDVSFGYPIASPPKSPLDVEALIILVIITLLRIVQHEEALKKNMECQMKGDSCLFIRRT